MAREILIVINDIDWDPEGDEAMELAIDLVRGSLKKHFDCDVQEIDI